MKKIRFTIFTFILLLTSTAAFADVNLTALAGGTFGAKGTTGDDATFSMPFNAFAAAQINFDSWGIFRGNIGLKSKDVTSGNIFVGQDSSIKLNELSLVLKKNSGTVNNFFGFYLGTYEVVGQDDFLLRQFGIEPISSLITKNETTLACGIPLYENHGVGISYTANFTEKPGTLGFNLYVNETTDKVPQLNLDLRTAWAMQYFTLDLAAGIGAPLQNKHNGTDVILLIDTLYFHSGITLLLGSNYTHALFLQAGIQNIKIAPGSFEKSFDNISDFSLVFEPRINTKILKTSLSLYSLPKNVVAETLYLNDSLGGVFTIYSDNISTKKRVLTLGLHCICSLKDESLFSLLENTDKATDLILNLYVTPFISFPVGTGNFETMAQVGLCNISKSPNVSYKLAFGYKREF